MRWAAVRNEVIIPLWVDWLTFGGASEPGNSIQVGDRQQRSTGPKSINSVLKWTWIDLFSVHHAAMWSLRSIAIYSPFVPQFLDCALGDCCFPFLKDCETSEDMSSMSQAPSPRGSSDVSGLFGCSVVCRSTCVRLRLCRCQLWKEKLLCVHGTFFRKSQLPNKSINSILFILKWNNLKQNIFLGHTFHQNTHVENAIPSRDSIYLDFHIHLCDSSKVSGTWQCSAFSSAPAAPQLPQPAVLPGTSTPLWLLNTAWRGKGCDLCF